MRAYVDGAALLVTNWLLDAEGALLPTELTAATCTKGCAREGTLVISFTIRMYSSKILSKDRRYKARVHSPTVHE